MSEFSMGQPGSIQMGNVGEGGNVSSSSSAGNLDTWNTALKAVKANTASTRILCLGDSTTFGNGSNSSSTGDFTLANYPTHLATLFNNASINAHRNSFMGFAISGQASPAINDGRLAMTTWGYASGVSLGGEFIFNSSNARILNFTPDKNVDTFNLFYPINGNTGGWGTLVFNIDGGTNTNINENTGAVPRLSTASINTGAVSSHTLQVGTSGSANTFFQGAEAYDSTQKWVSIINSGWSGSKSGDWNASTTGGWEPNQANTVSTISPSLTIMALGINDWNNSVSVAAYKANMQALITAYLAIGSVVLWTPPPSNPSGSVPYVTQGQFVAAMQQLAVSNNLPIVDIWTTWGTWANANSNGWMYDNLHPNGTGYGVIAQAIYNGIVR